MMTASHTKHLFHRTREHIIHILKSWQLPQEFTFLLLILHIRGHAGGEVTA